MTGLTESISTTFTFWVLLAKPIPTCVKALSVSCPSSYCNSRSKPWASMNSSFLVGSLETTSSSRYAIPWSTFYSPIIRCFSVIVLRTSGFSWSSEFRRYSAYSLAARLANRSGKTLLFPNFVRISLIVLIISLLTLRILSSGGSP